MTPEGYSSSFSHELQPRLWSLSCLQSSHQFTVDESVSDSTQITNYQISATVQDAGVHTQRSQSTDFLFGVMEINCLCCCLWSVTADRSLLVSTFPVQTTWSYVQIWRPHGCREASSQIRLALPPQPHSAKTACGWTSSKTLWWSLRKLRRLLAATVACRDANSPPGTLDLQLYGWWRSYLLPPHPHETPSPPSPCMAQMELRSNTADDGQP